MQVGVALVKSQSGVVPEQAGSHFLSTHFLVLLSQILPVGQEVALHSQALEVALHVGVSPEQAGLQIS